MRAILLILITALITGCGIFPRTHEELKADYAEHHTICSDRDIDELAKHLTKLSAICHVNIPEKKYLTTLEKESGKAVGVVAHEHHYSLLSSWDDEPYTIELGNNIGIFLLIELKQTTDCPTKLDYYYFNFFWKGAYKDHKAWTEGSSDCSDFL